MYKTIGRKAPEYITVYGRSDGKTNRVLLSQKKTKELIDVLFDEDVGFIVFTTDFKSVITQFKPK
jgi:hypothetical protein